jgi:hypothetical protein
LAFPQQSYHQGPFENRRDLEPIDSKEPDPYAAFAEIAPPPEALGWYGGKNDPRGIWRITSIKRTVVTLLALANRTGNRSHRMQGFFGALRVDSITGFLVATKTST